MANPTCAACPRPHLGQIDLLKGLAILGAMVQHVIGPDLRDAWSPLHIYQAVPIFFLLMGFNGAGSLRRHPSASLVDMYRPSYWTGRFDRLVAPFLLIWAIALVVGLAQGKINLGPLTLVGVLPVDGPGNYFVTIAFQFAVCFPLVFWLYRWAPNATVIGCLAVSVAFELLTPHVELLATGTPYLYRASILRCLGTIAVGMWLWDHRERASLRNPWLLALVAASIAYIVSEQLRPERYWWLEPGYTRSTNALACFYTLALVMLGIRFLPRRPSAMATSSLAAVGRASYHIFLVQIVWFALIDERTLAMLAPQLLVCCALGLGLERAMRHAPTLSRRPSRTWRPTTGRRSRERTSHEPV